MGSGVFLPTWPCTILALHRPCTPRRGAVAYGTQHDLRDGGRLDRYSIPRVGVRHYTASYAKRTVFARGRGFWRFPRYHSGPRVDHSVVETDNCSGKTHSKLSSLTLHSPPSRGPHRLTAHGHAGAVKCASQSVRVSQFPSRSPRAHHTVSEDAAPASAPLGQHNFTSRSTEY